MNYVKVLWQLAALKKNTSLNREELLARQNLKLRKLLEYA